jgi:manganese/zinc/iron transport system substrate-binding protein
VKAVFVESAVAPRIVEALIKPCQKRGHEIHVGGELYADALGPADSGAATYVGMIRANVNTIVAALK